VLIGNANVEELATGCATIAAFLRAAVEFGDVLCLQITAEMHNGARESVLPPSLHPTIPPALSLQLWRVGESPWGGFTMALARVSCRSGVRARGFSTAAVVSTEAACAGLRTGLGFPARVGAVTVRDGYDGASATVTDNGRVVLDINAIDPEPLSADDVQYTSTINLARTPNGLRLVQLEPEYTSTRVDRLRATLRAFDAAFWGNPRLDPYRVVSASMANCGVVVPPVRFVCKPDELAFTGTESVAVPS
jgi:hypothetical protein